MAQFGVGESMQLDDDLHNMNLNEPSEESTAHQRCPDETFTQLSVQQQEELARHQRYLDGTFAQQAVDPAKALLEDCKTAPLFSGPILTCVPPATFAQFGLLAGICSHTGDAPKSNGHFTNGASNLLTDNRMFLNVSAPWSAFICGSQGSGKSHTLSCMLESCLYKNDAGELKNPLAGIIFHCDTFTAHGSTQVCEAAYLSSAGIPVKVLVSPTNHLTLKRVYENLPGIPYERQPKVIPLKFQESQLNVARMKTLMAVSDKDGPVPLYIEVIMRILRSIAIERQGAPGLDYLEFRRQLDLECFQGTQNVPLKLRLDLLESFMAIAKRTGRKKNYRPLEETLKSSVWEFQPGTLTIVDLSCPFVDANAACALFNICLEIFLENRHATGRVVALDEAHKFMNGSLPATEFTESLLQVIRQQRHLATRVIIATQEPTISSDLLDLSSMTIVHRFTSPAWYKTLKDHLAGASMSRTRSGKGAENGNVNGEGGVDLQALFHSIVELNTGDALMFSPSAVLGCAQTGSLRGAPQKLGMEHVRIRVRARTTADGGKSLMAN